MKTQVSLALIGILIFLFSTNIYAQDATEIVRKADTKFNGEKSAYYEMSMTIVRPKYKRTLEFKGWNEGTENSLTLVTAPAKEKGQSFLKSGNNMWSWNPTIQRIVKLPPAMMSQGWMGSDYSNDDILKESSLTTDYHHQIIKNDEVIDGNICYLIQLTPKEDASVVWGKVELWIYKDQYLTLKANYYDEDDFLVKTHLAYDIKNFDDRKLPAVMEIIPAEEEGNKTIVTIKSMKFNIDLKPNFFSQQNMKRIR